MGRGLGFPDINTLEPLADALGIEVVELMRSEINTERRETAVDRKNVVEIMKSTAENIGVSCGKENRNGFNQWN